MQNSVLEENLDIPFNHSRLGMPYCIKEGADTIKAVDRLLLALNSWREADHLCRFHDKKDACKRLDPLASGYDNAKDKAYEKIKELSTCLMKK